MKRKGKDPQHVLIGMCWEGARSGSLESKIDRGSLTTQELRGLTTFSGHGN